MTSSVNQLHEVDAETVKQWLDEGSVLLIDVREKTEYDPEHLPGAVHCATSEFHPGHVPESGNRKLVFYCAAGMRSERAALRWLEGKSENAVAHNLTGGIQSWCKKGLPMVQSSPAESSLQGSLCILIGTVFFVLFVLAFFFGSVFALLGTVASGLLTLVGWKQPVLLAIAVAKIQKLWTR